jgi:sugar/nucleoside kinase (ribokinase family)
MGATQRRVVVFGEVLCDLFAPRAGQPLQQAAALIPHLGGAPANVAVQLARLQVPVALLTAVGSDPLGLRLLDELGVEGVDTPSKWTATANAASSAFAKTAPTLRPPLTT